MRKKPLPHWIVTFEIEPLISVILLSSILMSNGLILAGLSMRRYLPIFSHKLPYLLIYFGIYMLLLTPYFRVLASTFYFAFVERSLKHTLFSVFVFTLLTYILFRA